VYTEPVLEALTTDLKKTAPDHIAVTGDITNISLPAEFRRAGKWLGTLGTPDRISVIPGNHDAYTRISWEKSWSHWKTFMTSDDDTNKEAQGPQHFPFVRVRDRVAVVGVSSAVPTLPFLATGEIGARQMSALEEVLRDLKQQALFRIVLVHHPPVPGVAKPRKRLVDADAFGEMIARTGAELILHGHTHRSSVFKLDGPDGRVPVVGITSASANQNLGPGRHARYNLYRIPKDGKAGPIEVEVRGIDFQSGTFETERRFTL
jgi:3',5'-cyclic AMP phosphodiesterase CpdA